MQRYFFNIRENGVLKQDDEGVLCVDADQACHGASAAMRDFARDTAVVVGDWPVSLDVTDEQGVVIATISTEDCRETPVDCKHLSFCQ
ncbi:hypothetical protein DFI02_104160 [Rhizobium sp. PP-F2F-G20b]|nr:hypothetical protein DFI02_104160 [Rhizobium sp. PP-F2F-G20b]